MRASLNLVYELKERQLNLSINEASIQFPEQPATPVVLFAGNFSYDIGAIEGDKKANKVAKIIENWQQDLSEYSNLITEHFLALEPIKTGDTKGKAKSVSEDIEVIAAKELPLVLAGVG